MWTPHPDAKVNAALIRLNDALCTWERSTGRESVLIVRETGWQHRSMSGKSLPEGNGVSDVMLLQCVTS
jgi:hypothetical protein